MDELKEVYTAAEEVEINLVENRDQLIALLEENARTATGNQDALTTRELCAALGWNVKKVRARLHELKDTGGLEVVPKQVQTLDGRINTVSAYRLKYPKMG